MTAKLPMCVCSVKSEDDGDYDRDHDNDEEDEDEEGLYYYSTKMVSMMLTWCMLFEHSPHQENPPAL